jgi:hypothetical protein
MIPVSVSVFRLRDWCANAPGLERTSPGCAPYAGSLGPRPSATRYGLLMDKPAGKLGFGWFRMKFCCALRLCRPGFTALPPRIYSFAVAHLQLCCLIYSFAVAHLQLCLPDLQPCRA